MTPTRDIVSGRFDAGIRVGRRVARDMQIVRVTEPSRLIAIASPEYLPHHPAPKAPSGPATAQLHQFPQRAAMHALGVRQG